MEILHGHRVDRVATPGCNELVTAGNRLPRIRVVRVYGVACGASGIAVVRDHGVGLRLLAAVRRIGEARR